MPTGQKGFANASRQGAFALASSPKEVGTMGGSIVRYAIQLFIARRINERELRRVLAQFPPPRPRYAGR